MKKKLVIVGAGPAGLFAAVRLCKYFRVSLIESGREINQRICAVKQGKNCTSCKPCNILHGVGGAGFFSDGKINYHPKVGGDLTEFLTESEIEDKFNELDNILADFGDKSKTLFDSKFNEELLQQAKALDFKFIPIKQKHLGSDNMFKIIETMVNYLKQNDVEIICNKKVIAIQCFNKIIKSLQLHNGQVISSDIFVLGTGLATQDWLYKELHKLGIKKKSQSVHVGVRIEFDSQKYSSITDKIWDPKFYFFTDAEKHNVIRTYCTNPNGFVLAEKYDDFLAVNGHAEKEKSSKNTNFALMTEVVPDDNNAREFGRNFCLAVSDATNGDVMVQKYVDFKHNESTTNEDIASLKITPTLISAMPGNLSKILPDFIRSNIIFAIEKINRLVPNFCDENLIIYGPEVKFDTNRIKCKKDLSTKIQNLFVIGDGGGVSRGLAHAIVSGLIVGDTIIKTKFNMESKQDEK
ncbi:MAG: hypothetical protein U9Q69_05630 [Nanoarchaeota archaeon]|nr:hypothetical protein [Nanoarchaeota archaeon]